MIGETTTADNGKSGSRALVFDRILGWATTALFFLLPLQSRYLVREVPLYEWGTISVYGVEVLGWIVIVLGLLKYREAEPRVKRRLSLGFLALPVWAFLSIVWAPDKAIALQAAVRLLEGVLLYVILAAPRDHIGLSPVAGLSPKSGLVTSAAWAFLAGAFLQAGLGIYQFLTQSSFASTFLGMALHDPRALGTSVVEFADERWLRAYGGLPHPNVLGGYLVVALAMAVLMWPAQISAWQKFQSGKQRVVLMAVMLILLTGIFFSFSRAAWGAVVIIGVWMAIGQIRKVGQKGKSKKNLVGKNDTAASFLPTLLLIAYVAFLLIVYRPLVIARVVSQSRLETKSRVERVQGMQEAWQMVRAHPILGVGIGNYTQSVARELRPDQPLYFYQPVHNVPLLIWAELGLVGLALFAGVLYFIVKQSRPAVLLSCCFAVLLMADHYLWTLPFGILLFWAMMGVAQGFSPDKSGLKA